MGLELLLRLELTLVIVQIYLPPPEFPELYISGVELCKLNKNYPNFTKELIIQELVYWNIALSSLEFNFSDIREESIKDKTCAYIDENTEELRGYLISNGLKPLDPFTNEGRGIMAPCINGDFYKTCTKNKDDNDVDSCYFCSSIEEFKSVLSILENKTWTIL